MAQRTTASPLESLEDMDVETERAALQKSLDRAPTPEELIMYLNHPGDALKTINFVKKYGNPNCLPLDVWFEGLEKGAELQFEGSCGKPHMMRILEISEPDDEGMCEVRYVIDSEILSCQVKVAEASSLEKGSLEMVDPKNVQHVGSPSNGDLWVMHVRPGDVVKKGEELFNISIMKQEKAVLAPTEGMVKRVLKFANFEEDRKMVPVVEGELLVELGPMPRVCPSCNESIPLDDCKFCPNCGQKCGLAVREVKHFHTPGSKTDEW